MYALATINDLPETREQQRTFVHMAIEEIMNGDYDPARLYAKLRIIQDTLKDILDSKTFQNYAIDEIEKYNGDCQINGNKISVATKSSYDFSVCNYSEYQKALSVIAEAKEIVKKSEAFLKAITKPVADPETGEMIYPPVKSVTQYIVVK